MEPELSLLFDPAEYPAQPIDIPNQQQVAKWISRAIAMQQPKAQGQLVCEVSVIFMAPNAIQALNKQYRGKDHPTNVLSFPSDLPTLTPRHFQTEQSVVQEGAAASEHGLLVLGDIILCPEIVLSEAQAQRKKPLDHWAHMLVHGTFHLLGMDHQEEIEANTMESLEIQLLSELGIGNPYEALSGIHQ